MTTTWIKPIHKNKGKSVVGTLADSIGYAENPDKTNGFEYVKSYGCDYYTAANEFALAKTIYEQRTGRVRSGDDIIAFHLRQSFKPGEIEPAEALEIGYKLCEKFTHGKHQFVVAVHTDKEHIHCHAIFSAVNLDCNGKFRNPMRSMKIVRQISDFLCAEHGLSIVENPQPSRGSYVDWQDKKEPQTNRDKLAALIDEKLIVGRGFTEFLVAMKRVGCEIKLGKYLAFKLPGAERFIRVKSLGDDYTEQALRERCRGVRNVKTFSPSVKSNAPSLLIDIQNKIREGKGEGYVQWSKIFNLRESAKTLIFLQENGIDSYDDLKNRASHVSGENYRLIEKLRAVEAEQKSITELQKQIGTYGKTRAIYEAYRKSGWKRSFYDAHTTDIILHRSAKKFLTSKISAANSCPSFR
jgi:hypothetical protein